MKPLLNCYLEWCKWLSQSQVMQAMLFSALTSLIHGNYPNGSPRETSQHTKHSTVQHSKQPIASSVTPQRKQGAIFYILAVACKDFFLQWSIMLAPPVDHSTNAPCIWGINSSLRHIGDCIYVDFLVYLRHLCIFWSEYSYYTGSVSVLIHRQTKFFPRKLI